MKNLGIKNEFIEKEGPDFKKIRYPKVRFPLSFIEGEDVELNDEVELKVKGKLVGMINDKYDKVSTFELTEGEIINKKKKKTLLGK